MGLMNLYDQFLKLGQPSENDGYQFSATPIKNFETHRIAKDKHNNPTLLVHTTDKTSGIEFNNFKLQNVTVLFNVNCKIRQEEIGNESILEFTTITFVGINSDLKKYFIKLCSTLIVNLGKEPKTQHVFNEVARFIELLSLAVEPSTKTIQGLWAELFVLNESKDPANLLRYWHSIPQEKFDFSNGNERLEIKSYSSEDRIHNFAIEQLYALNDSPLIIASVKVKQIAGGRSIESLMDEIEFRIHSNNELIHKFRSQVASILGEGIIHAGKVNFDYELAKESHKLFDSVDIPKIALSQVPNFVTEVRFKSDLSSIIPLDKSIVQRRGILYSYL